MTINKSIDQENMKISVSGRLDTTTSPQLEAVMKESLSGIKFLEFDMKDLEYISSSGLRVLLSTQKIMNEQGKMVIRNVNDTVKEVFELTGFVDVMDIE